MAYNRFAFGTGSVLDGNNDPESGRTIRCALSDFVKWSGIPDSIRNHIYSCEIGETLGYRLYTTGLSKGKIG